MCTLYQTVVDTRTVSSPSADILGMGPRLGVTSGISGCEHSTGETLIKWHGFQTPFKLHIN